MYRTGIADVACGQLSFNITDLPPPPAQPPKCGKDTSKVPQQTFASGQSTLFDGFCKSWSQEKKQSATVYTDGGHVAFTYEPDTGGKKCTMTCSDAFTSMSIGCAAGNGNGASSPSRNPCTSLTNLPGDMYTTGSGDFGCGKFSFNITPEPEETTFYFGSTSSDTNSSPFASPFQAESSCSYIMVKDGDDICDAGNITPSDNSGGCGGNYKSPDFCGQQLLLGYPKGYILSTYATCAVKYWLTQEQRRATIAAPRTRSSMTRTRAMLYQRARTTQILSTLPMATKRSVNVSTTCKTPRVALVARLPKLSSPARFTSVVPSPSLAAWHVLLG